MEVMLIDIDRSNVPEYLHNGKFYRSLDIHDEGKLSVPDRCLKGSVTVNNVEDVVHLLSSLSFWGVEEFPFELVQFIMENDPNVIRGDIVESYLI